MVVIILILIGVIIYLVAFNASNNNLKQQIHHQGGMLLKYSTLINYLESLDPNFKILAVTDKTVTIGYNVPSGYIDFHIVQTFVKLHVRFNLQNNIIGHNKFDWDFNPSLDQAKMFEEIQQGLALFDTKLSNKHFE
ncbi:MAG: hypothetical protein GW809_04585 [Bacteroidetes bacterium]|nr:hypothetical protein [Bacteroidota bacterium]